MKLRIVAVIAACIAVGMAYPDMMRPKVTAGNGEQYVAGQLIVKLMPSQRALVHVTNAAGQARFGIAALDEVCARYAVDDITPLSTDPHPSALALKHGIDLEYSIQFPVDRDVNEVASSLTGMPEIEYTCPNWLMKLDETPNDPSYGVQWHLAKLAGPVAWGIAHGDTTVWNAAIDDGVDWLHPDITANLRINQAEDINHNGRFDSLPVAQGGDIDNVDNDGNGRLDDVIGYDFIGNDPKPFPQAGDDHGTHCWGTTNAVTNNGVGIAGPSWNARSFGVRAGYGGSVYLTAAVSAVNYVIAQGVWAISMSFGGSTTYQPLQNACQYGWDAGCVLFGSAGNDGQEVVRYPACYDGVECVAASNQSDTRADFSNWGTWIDVSSPGVSIYSTVPRSSGSYANMDGTSMAAPLAAGVACWIKSWNHSLTNQQALDIMYDACDTMPDANYRAGKLGAGRVSLGNVVLRTYYCDMDISSWRAVEPSGNGRPDPGETVSFVVTLANDFGWSNATGVSADLTCTNPAVIITKGHSTFPDIPAGSSGNNSADSFVVTIPADLAPQRLIFPIALHSSPGSIDSTSGFVAVCGSPRVLLVDDDAGADYERWYRAALDSNRVLYDDYSVQSSGSPTEETLEPYPVVIWFTGNDSTTTLTGDDMTALTGYLSSGKNLMIVGQNIAQDIDGSSFLTDYLHASFVADSVGKIYVVGLPGDTITRGDTIALGGSGGAGNGLKSADGIRPVGGAVGAGFYKDYADTTVQAVIHYAGSYKVVYFACAFEAMDQSASRYLQKWTIIQRVLEFFGEPRPGVTDQAGSVPLATAPVLRIIPNPVRGTARVSFDATIAGPVQLRVFAADGRLVQDETRNVGQPGNLGFTLDGAKLGNGVFLVQLVTPAGVYAQKTAIVR